MPDQMITIRCACGWESMGKEDDVIAATTEHGRQLHNMTPTRDEVLAMVVDRSHDGPAEQLDRPTVLQMRLVVEADDYDEAVRFYRDVLGLPEEAAFEGEGDARVTILDAGRATLEIANPAQKRLIDDVEVGHLVAPKMRVAFEVADSAAITDKLVSGGAELIAAPRETPWRSLNSRLSAPAGLQLTVFQELETLEERSSKSGFGTGGFGTGGSGVGDT